jgi:hypothetical protein
MTKSFGSNLYSAILFFLLTDATRLVRDPYCSLPVVGEPLFDGVEDG